MDRMAGLPNLPPPTEESRHYWQSRGESHLRVAMRSLHPADLEAVVRILLHQGLDARAMYERVRVGHPEVPPYEEILAHIEKGWRPAYPMAK